MAPSGSGSDGGSRGPAMRIGMGQPIEVAGAGAGGKKVGKAAGIGAAALEAGTVAGGQRRHLVEEEQFGIAPPHDRAMAAP